MRRNMKVRNVVVGVRSAFNCSSIDSILDDETFEWCSGDYRLADDDVTPCRRHLIASNANLDTMHMHRAIVTAADVIFARPDQFDRRAAKTLCNHRGFSGNV